MKIIFLIAIFLFVNVSANENSTSVQVISSIEKNGQNSYKDLISLKADENFIARGLSYPKAMKWYKQNQNFEKKCGVELRKLPIELRFSGKLSDMCTSFNYLGQVGMHYAKHSNSDDKFTIKFLIEIKKAFKIKK